MRLVFSSCCFVLVLVIVQSNAEAQYVDHFPDSFQFFRSAALPQSSLGSPTQEDPKQLLLKADARTFFTVTLTVH